MVANSLGNYSTAFLDAKKSLRELEAKYQDYLIVNHDLDRTLVSFQANKSEPLFSWFHYREGFSKRLIEYILDSMKLETDCTLLDPFAGTGAAPFVAANYKNMSAIGIELMPVGSFVMQCRNIFSNIRQEQIIKYAKDALSSRDQWLEVKAKWKFRHLRITQDAFPTESEQELCQFKTWLSYQSDEKYRVFLDFVAFSVLEQFSFTRKDGQYLRWDHRSPRFQNSSHKTTFDKGKISTFYEALSEKLNQIISDFSIQYDLFQTKTEEYNKKITILKGSVLEKIDEIKDNYIDVVITSPPYCNRYDYTRTYALELAYLGIDEVGIRKLRQELLTCTVENKPKSFYKMEKSLKKIIDEVFLKQRTLSKVIFFLKDEARSGRLNNKGIQTMVEGYFYDSTVHLAQISSKMKAGGYYVMVNDNVRYNGLDIPVDLLLSEIASEFGLATEKIWVLPKGKGNSSQQMKKHGRSELRKCVCIWKKVG